MLQTLIRRPRRLLMTVDAVGGVWRYALDLARTLAEGGDSIVLAGVGPEPSPEQQEEARTVATLRWLRTPPDWITRREAELDGLPAELAGLVRDHAIDVVHLNAPTQAAGLDLPCPVVAVSHSCVVTWLHAVKGQVAAGDWAWQATRNRRGFDAASTVVAPSHAHAQMLEACYGPIERLTVVGNAVRRKSMKGMRENMVFAAARWWDDGKNAAVLDEAAALVRRPILAAGSLTGPDGQRARFSHVVALDAVAPDEVRRLMARAGLFVSPSVYEPFGLAALEAAAAGTPLLLADIATYRELWAGAAVFFPPRDASALAAAIERLSRDERERRRLGRAAARRAERFSTARQAAAMRYIYDRAMIVAAGR
jgi:glycosyltransferase involved in cell wall biosynthesis